MSDTQTDGHMDTQTDTQMDGHTDGQTHANEQSNPNIRTDTNNRLNIRTDTQITEEYINEQTQSITINEGNKILSIIPKNTRTNTHTYINKTQINELFNVCNNICPNLTHLQTSRHNKTDEIWYYYSTKYEIYDLYLQLNDLNINEKLLKNEIKLKYELNEFISNKREFVRYIRDGSEYIGRNVRRKFNNKVSLFV